MAEAANKLDLENFELSEKSIEIQNKFDINLEKSKKEYQTKLKHYETKIMTLTVINGALQSENEKMKEENLKLHKLSQSDAISELQKEFTERLAGAEKTASSMKEECFCLRKELEEKNHTLLEKRNEIEEKDKIVDQYKCEGEVLAKKIMELESIIKKLRAEIMKTDQEKEKLNAKVQVLEASAKTVEITKLASLDEANQNLIILKNKLSEQKEKFNLTIESVQKRHEEELETLRNTYQEKSSKKKNEIWEQEKYWNEMIQSLTQKISEEGRKFSEKEEKYKEEITNLEKKLRRSEMESEENVSSFSSFPFMKQIENLSSQISDLKSTLEKKEYYFSMEEKNFRNQIDDLTEAKKKTEAKADALEKISENEKNNSSLLQSENLELRSKLKDLENALNFLKGELEMEKEKVNVLENTSKQLSESLSNEKTSKENLRNDFEIWKWNAESDLKEEREKHLNLKSEFEKLESKINSFHALDSGKSRFENETLGPENQILQSKLETSDPRVFQMDSASFLKMSSGSNRLSLEMLQAKIKQQSGEIYLLQKNLEKSQNSNEIFSEEIFKLTEKIKNMEKENKDAAGVKKELVDLRKRHEMALIIIGERNEKVEELESDIVDVRKLYREQINLLVNQVDPGKWPQGYRICLFCSHCAQEEKKKRAND